MKKKGFIQRVQNPNDKRKRMVSLTEEGRKLSILMIEHQKKFKEEIFINFSDEEYEEFVRLLGKLFTNVSNIIH